MNKKGKNKKGKTINPSPTQKEKPNDEVVVSPHNENAQSSDIVQEKSVSVKEERVPEIVNEVILLSINTKDEETPKKPKRNRGKKKKGSDENNDNFEGDSKDHANILESKENVTLPPVEVKSQNVTETIPEPQEDTFPVAPTARKKKNKKKNAEPKSDDPILQVAEHIPLTRSISDTLEQPEMTKTKEEAKIEQITIPQEVNPSKKKNKKKKRNDSERSDIDDNTCTSTFKKLLNVKTESLETKLDDNTKISTVPTESSKCESEIIQDIIKIQETTKEKEILISTETTSTQDDYTQVQSPPIEKKDKKQKSKDHKDTFKGKEIIPHAETPFESVTMPVDKIITQIEQEVSKNIETVGKTENPTVEIPDVENTMSKHKAKIAKPVDKKRKEKQEPAIIDTLQQNEIISEPSNIEELNYQNITGSIELKEKATKIPSNVENKDLSKLVEPSRSKEICEQDVELHNVQDKSVGKKLRKGPKIPRASDVSFEIIEPKETNISDTKTADISQNLSTSEILSISASETSVTKQVTDVETLTTDINTQVKPQEHILLTPEIIEGKDTIEVPALTSDMPEKNVKSETKSSKKRRKSSKSPSKVEVVSKPVELSIQTHDTGEDLSSEDSKQMEAKVDMSKMTKLYDIEITNISIDESEGSACDTVPDITYPRSTSQQLPDNNNNNSATIREIFPIQVITPDAPKPKDIKVSNDNLVIKESKETNPPKMEKTDLKSKMLEVNQDMEGLRLSIERSLAEFTSIEKHEAETEKQYEKSKLSSTKITKIKEDIGTKLEKDEHEKITTAYKIEPSKESQFTEQTKTKDKIEPLLTIENKQSVEFVEQQFIKPAYKEGKEMKLDSAVTDITSEDSKRVDPVIDTKVSQSASTSMAEKLTETLLKFDTKANNKALIKREKTEETSVPAMPIQEKINLEHVSEHKNKETNSSDMDSLSIPPAIRKDQKNKNKKKKGKQDTQMTASQSTQSTQSTAIAQTSTSTSSQETKEGDKNKDKKEGKSETTEKGKQQASNIDEVKEEDSSTDVYDPIENFEDALTSSVDDVNQSFEMIVKESQEQYNPKINIIAPDEVKSSVKPSKNLLGHPDIPVRSSKRDYKKEKDKIPNEISAKVKIKDSVNVDGKQTKNTQTMNKLNTKYYKTSENEEFVYKYNFREVFLQNTCHVCKKDLSTTRVACCYCNLVFYCGIKHKDEDWPQHQALCFAVSTIGHLKDQKHIYADAKNITGHDYRLIRMQMIVSCEKILKRRLVPWEQEALLYPRMCAYVPCREWRQTKLSDCSGCAQISFCTENPDHYPKSHSRWCKSYSLYQKLVSYQQTKGRLEPKLPTKVMEDKYEIPEKINELLAGMYEEKIDMNDIQYAALTQLATAPLTAAYCHQLCCKKNLTANGYKTFVVHVVGAELQFEADALNKWEVFFLHLRPDLQHLKVVLINSNLNPSKLPLDLLGKIKLCENCRQKKRIVVFSFEERSYADYKSSEDFILPDIVCAFNPSIQRSSVYNGKDPWPAAVNIIIKQKIPFLITAYTLSELQKDCTRIKECADPNYNFISEPKYNNFASVRPDRNFISDDEMPLLFKNYCFAVICG